MKASAISRRLAALLLSLMALLALALPARADIGPKPSVSVTIRGLEGQRYAVTLLSDTWRYGPWQAGAGYSEWMGDKALYDAFAAYEAPAGWYFQGEYADCTESGVFRWNYWPPERFLVLVYLPEQDAYLCSAPCARYAFRSAYTATAAGGALTVAQSYDYGPELWSFAARVLATIALEAALGWLVFGLRGRAALRVVLCANAATQLALNLVLNLCGYHGGPWMAIAAYAAAELAVLAAEGLAYARWLRWPEGRRARPWLYALAANALSFGAGLWLAQALPGVL